MDSDLLTIDELTIRFRGSSRPVVNKISMRIGKGERVGLIGESGSGKSLTALAITGLLDEGAQCSGSIRLAGQELLGLHDSAYSKVRGEKISMVFQEPKSALDPTMRTGRQVAEVLQLHNSIPHGQVPPRVVEMLEKVGIGDPARVADSYPHQLSGGQRQRVLIAMAMINTPDLLICDEPTTALDVTVQDRVVQLLRSELDKAGSGLLFISHDIAVVSQMVDQIAVIYNGVIVEQGSRTQILRNPQHPYTAGLIATADLATAVPGGRLPVLDDFWTRPSK